MLGPILKRIGIGVGLATLLVIVVAMFLPRQYTVSRSVVIDAPLERVHELCSDLERWPSWTPWFRADPGMEITLGGITRGEGAHQSWRSKDGAGELTFTRCDPEWGVAFDLHFVNRGEDAVSTIRYDRTGGRTAVTWDMTGDTGWNPIARFMGIVMDPLFGPMFEDGLERLKLVAEGRAPGALDLQEIPDTTGAEADTTAETAG
jgi:hypothetical protein